MIIPGAVMSVLPIRSFVRYGKKHFYGTIAAVVICAVIFGSFICTASDISSNTFTFPCLIVFYLLYHLFVDLPFRKKIFCFANSTMLCSFATTYTTFLTAPFETGNESNVYMLSSGLICLVIAALTCIVFFKSMTVKIPYLLENDSFEKLWKYMILPPVLMTLLLVWTNPVDADNVMVGRLRPISLVLFLLIPIVIWFILHIIWQTALRSAEYAMIIQNYDILRMEEKQYRKTRQYLNETAEMRHNFRQHILVMDKYAKSGEFEKLTEYIGQFTEKVTEKHKRFCENQAVDAIAANYDNIAEQRDTVIMWSLNLPETIPVKEYDLCSVIGNLLENAIIAVSGLEKDKRKITVGISIKAGETIVISVSNPYTGIIRTDKNGLPKSEKAGHGIGLRSVDGTVKKYNGSLVIQTKDNIFDVSILMYAPD